jgi:hypothetical protein
MFEYLNYIFYFFRPRHGLLTPSPEEQEKFEFTELLPQHDVSNERKGSISLKKNKDHPSLEEIRIKERNDELAKLNGRPSGVKHVTLIAKNLNYDFSLLKTIDKGTKYLVLNDSFNRIKLILDDKIFYHLQSQWDNIVPSLVKVSESICPSKLTQKSLAEVIFNCYLYIVKFIEGYNVSLSTTESTMLIDELSNKLGAIIFRTWSEVKMKNGRAISFNPKHGDDEWKTINRTDYSNIKNKLTKIFNKR